MNKIMSGKKCIFLLIPFLLFVLACDRVVDDQEGDEMARLQAWLQVNNITTQPTPSGLYYVSKQEGTGETPVDTNYIVFSLSARNLDGDVLETTDKYTAKLNDIYKPTTHYVPRFAVSLMSLKGLTEGIGMMKEGGNARLIIPSKIGFGNSGYTFSSGMKISPYTTLIYDLELLKVVTDPNAYEQSLLAEYFSKNSGFNSISDSIYIKNITAGTRDCIVANDSVVQVNYVGRFLDGFIFDTNIESIARDSSIYSSSTTKYNPLEFTVGVFNSDSPLPGFQLAVKHMIEGEKAIVIIPSTYMYGALGNSIGSTLIPPYTTLIFEMELVNVDAKGTTH